MTAYLATLEHTGLSLYVNDLTTRPFPASADVPYDWIRVNGVPPAVMLYASQEIVRLAAELGIEPPPFYWFRPSPGAGDFTQPGVPGDDRPSIMGGYAVVCGHAECRSPSAIWILSTLRGDALCMVIAHELRHIAQDASMSREEREEDAERYGVAHVG